MAGASGVSLTSGGYRMYSSSGVSTRQVRPGARPAVAQVPAGSQGLMWVGGVGGLGLA